LPTYDYRCNACGHEFELFQSMTEKPKRKCPKCAALKLERLIGIGAGVIFKGGGFYETDYRSESYKKAAEADKKAADSGKSEGKSDSKPEKKSDAKPDTKPDKNSEPAGGGKKSKKD